MTQQLVLIQPIATKTSDPITSYLAELEVTSSGRRATHQALVLALVTRFPGLCAEQVGEQTGLGRTEAARRLSDLKTLGYVERADRVTWNGSSQSRWYVTERTEAAMASGAAVPGSAGSIAAPHIDREQKDDAASA